MQMFPSEVTLKFGAIEFIGNRVKKLRQNQFLLTVRACFYQLVNTVPLSSISAGAVAEATISYCVLSHGPHYLPLSEKDFISPQISSNTYGEFQILRTFSPRRTSHNVRLIPKY